MSTLPARGRCRKQTFFFASAFARRRISADKERASEQTAPWPRLGPALAVQSLRPWVFHALIQSCRSLREIPSLRATGETPSPPSARLIAFNLYAVGNRRFFTFAATGHPQNEPVTAIIVSHLWGAVQHCHRNRVKTNQIKAPAV